MPPIMQSIPLPVIVNLRASVQQQRRYEGYYPSPLCTRLAGATEGVVSELRATICFSQDVQQRLVVRGEAHVEVSLLCQRCHDCFVEMLSVDYCVSPVLDDRQAKALPSVYDPWLIDQYEQADLIRLIEDELLLSLPLAAVHPNEGCSAAVLAYLNSPLLPVVGPVKRNSPFGALLSLKETKL
jgi:uncharacterized protein